MKLRPYLITFAVLFVLLYLIGGTSGLRTLRARYRAWTQPPTAAELARAGPDTLPTPPVTTTRFVNGKKVPLSDPATVGEAAKIIVAVLVIAVSLMFLTGRAPEP